MAKVGTLGAFYASPSGKKLQDQLSSVINACWHDFFEARVLMLGYSTPFYDVLANKSPQSITEHDPMEMNGRLPFSAQSFDYVLLINALEYMPEKHTLLREIWRVMAPQSSLLCVTPNQSMLWNIGKTIPNIQERFSAQAIKNLLSEAMFYPIRQYGTLYFPTASKLTNPIEKVLSFFSITGGTFIATHAVKQAVIPISFEKARAYKSTRISKASTFSSPR